MAREIKLPNLNDDEALQRIIGWLNNPKRNTDPMSRPNYGHDLYIPNVIQECLAEVQQQDVQRDPVQGMRSYHPDGETGSEPFYNAVWSLCTRGILRPDPTRSNNRYDNGEVVGAGFAITNFGKQWLTEASGYECLPVEYGRFSQLLAGHSARFGTAYQLRGQEAVSCYRAHTYLACCVMCGAATESILLKLAIVKTGNEERVLREYRTAKGRTAIENLLLSNQNSYIRQELPNYTNLLKYWRDDAAHGENVSIGEGEAFTSLILLLRFAQFADDRWEEITN
jgi:hypothetical protein